MVGYAFSIFVCAFLVFGLDDRTSIIANLTFIPFSAFSTIRILEKRYFKLETEEIALLAFLLTAICSAFLSDSLLISLKYCYSIGSLWLLFVFGNHVLSATDYRIIENSYVLGAMFLAGWTTLVDWNGIDRLNFGDGSSTNALGVIFASCALMMINRAFKGGTIKYGILSLLFVVVMLLTKSRRAVILFAVSFLLLALIPEKGQKIYERYRKRATIAFTAIALVFGIKSGFVLDKISRFFAIKREIVSGRNTSITLRLHFIRTGMEEFLKKPILGHGAGTSSEFLEGTSFHNNYIQLLYELGVIGLFFYLLFLLICFIKAAKSKSRMSAVIIIFILIAGLFGLTYRQKLYYILLVLSQIYSKHMCTFGTSPKSKDVPKVKRALSMDLQ